MTTELAYTYNDFGLPVKLTYTDVDGETRTVREETNLTYDGNGNILTEAVTEAYTGSTTKTRTYQYDLGNRLISATYDGTTTTYTYDAVGNRLTRQKGTETAETYTYNYLNQLTRVQQGTAVTTYTYDARGNQTQQVQTGTGVTTTSTYGYDLANRLISSGISNNAVNPLSTSATYAYNAQGQRVTRVEDEVVTHFYYTGSALLFTTVNEYVLQTQNILDPAGSIVASKRFEGQAATGQDPYADDYFFYRYDVRGSVTNIVDGEGAVVKSYDYDEFGVTTSTGDAFFNEVTFTGSVADASGLLYMNARYYNPSTARFLSQDTYTGSASVPWTQHLYAYCNNNPVNMVDPTGHMAGRSCTVNINDGGGGLSSYELVERSVAPEDPLEKYSGIRDSIVIKRENEAQFLLNQCEDETIDLISNYDMTGACDMLANQIRIAYFEVYNEEFFATQGQLSFEIQLHIEGYFWARDIQTEYNGQIQTYSCPPIFDLYREIDITILSWIRGETPERDRRAYILRKCRTVEISQDSKAENIYFYKWR